MQDLVGGTDKMNQEKEALEAERDGYAENLQALIDQNARIVQSQEEYVIQYEKLSDKYRKAEEKVKEIEQAVLDKERRLRRMNTVVEAVENMPETVTEFSSELWATLIDRLTVYGKDDIRFTLVSGAEIRV